MSTVTELGTVGPAAQSSYNLCALMRCLGNHGCRFFSARNLGLLSSINCAQSGRMLWTVRASHSCSELLPVRDPPNVPTRSPGCGTMSASGFNFWPALYKSSHIFRQEIIVPVAYPGNDIPHSFHKSA